MTKKKKNKFEKPQRQHVRQRVQRQHKEATNRSIGAMHVREIAPAAPPASKYVNAPSVCFFDVDADRCNVAGGGNGGTGCSSGVAGTITPRRRSSGRDILSQAPRLNAKEGRKKAKYPNGETKTKNKKAKNQTTKEKWFALFSKKPHKNKYDCFSCFRCILNVLRSQ